MVSLESATSYCRIQIMLSKKKIKKKKSPCSECSNLPNPAPGTSSTSQIRHSLGVICPLKASGETTKRFLAMKKALEGSDFPFLPFPGLSPCPKHLGRSQAQLNQARPELSPARTVLNSRKTRQDRARICLCGC